MQYIYGNITIYAINRYNYYLSIKNKTKFFLRRKMQVNQKTKWVKSLCDWVE